MVGMEGVALFVCLLCGGGVACRWAATGNLLTWTRVSLLTRLVGHTHTACANCHWRTSENRRSLPSTSFSPSPFLWGVVVVAAVMVVGTILIFQTPHTASRVVGRRLYSVSARCLPSSYRRFSTYTHVYIIIHTQDAPSCRGGGDGGRLFSFRRFPEHTECVRCCRSLLARSSHEKRRTT